jgi:hypothetical protein
MAVHKSITTELEGPNTWAVKFMGTRIGFIRQDNNRRFSSYASVPGDHVHLMASIGSRDVAVGIVVGASIHGTRP